MLRKISHNLNKKLFSSVPVRKPQKASSLGVLWGVSAVGLFAASLGIVGYQVVGRYESDDAVRAHIQKDHPDVAAIVESFASKFRLLGIITTTPPPKEPLKSSKIVTKSVDDVPHTESKSSSTPEAEKVSPAVSESQVAIQSTDESSITNEINLIEKASEPSPMIDHELPVSISSETEPVIAQVEVQPAQSTLHSHHETPEVTDSPSPVESKVASHSHAHDSHAHDVAHAIVQSTHGHEDQYKSGLPAVEAEARAKHVHSDATASALKEHEHYAAALRKEVEASLLRDLDTLGLHDLRIRLNTLASELLDRASWEGVRLHEAAKVVEADLVRKFNDVLEAQRVELEKERSSKIIAREIEISQALSAQSQDALVRFESKLHETLRSQFETLQSSLNRELQEISIAQEQENSIDNLFLLASTRNKHVEQLMVVQEQLLDIAAQLSALGRVSNTMQEQNEAIKRTHKQSSVLAGLEFALRSSKAVNTEIAAVQSVFGEQKHEFIDTIIRTLPQEATSSGVLTLTELRTRFRVVREEVRKAAMAPPDAPQIVGQLVGSALATISKPPQGLVRGDGVEEILSRAAFHLEGGRLYEAVQEMNTVPGAMPKRVADDWIAAAVARLRSDVASTSLRSLSLLLSTEYKP